MNNGYSLCVLCCCSFGTGSRTSATICRQDLLNFFKVLVDSPPQFTQDSKLSVSDLQSIILSSGLSVCVDCHSFITVALETRSRAEKMELKVRKLQMQILEQLRVLQSEMDLFQQEMTKLESVVKTSDESCLMFHMPRNGELENNGGRGNGILVLRERILDVVTDLRIYQVSCTADARLHVDETEMEAMWEDAQQLVQCTPDISMDNDDPLTTAHFNDSSGKGGGDNYDNDSEPQVERKYFGGQDDPATAYMGHSIGTDFYVEGESDTEMRPLNFNFKDDVIRRAPVREENRNPEQGQSSDPLRRYYLKYETLQDRLSVGPVEVIINEEDETLQCSMCTIMGKRSKSNSQKQNWRDMEKGIVVHIIGKHLGGFTCAHCQEVFTSHTMIKKHVSKEHVGQTVSSVVVATTPPPLLPILPPPMPVPPLSTEKTVGKNPKKYACSMCSSAFRKPSELKRHFISRHTQSQQVGLHTPVILASSPHSPSPSKPSKPCPKSKKSGVASITLPPVVLGAGTVGWITVNDNKPTKSKQRPHECHICKYAFTKGSHLKRHLEVHRKRNELV